MLVHFEGDGVSFLPFFWQVCYVMILWGSFWCKLWPGSEKREKKFISKLRFFEEFSIFEGFEGFVFFFWARGLDAKGSPPAGTHFVCSDERLAIFGHTIRPGTRSFT